MPLSKLVRPPLRQDSTLGTAAKKALFDIYKYFRFFLVRAAYSIPFIDELTEELGGVRAVARTILDEVLGGPPGLHGGRSEPATVLGSLHFKRAVAPERKR
jgi:hypothetical protein